MTRAVLPGMRGRRSGTVVNFSSVGGLVAVQTVKSAHPPLRLVLGRMALETAGAKLAALRQEFDDWAAVSADDPDSER